MNQKQCIMARKAKTNPYVAQFSAAQIRAMRAAVDEFKSLPPGDRAMRLNQLKITCGNINQADEISRNNARAVREFIQRADIETVKLLCGNAIQHSHNEWNVLINQVAKQFGIQPAEISMI
jgi:hypothetical protein